MRVRIFYALCCCYYGELVWVWVVKCGGIYAVGEVLEIVQKLEIDADGCGGI